MRVGKIWFYLWVWIFGNSLGCLLFREPLPLMYWYSMIVFVSCITFLSFLEPHNMPDIPKEEPKDDKPNVKAAKVQGHVSGKPIRVHTPVSK
jgi:hypothetical protein